VLAFHDRVTLAGGAAVAVPVRARLVELEALLRNATLADAAPAAVGAKASWNDKLLPAAIVTGRVRPLKENCDVLTPADVTVIAELAAVRVPVWPDVLPTTTLPKLRLVGETASVPGRVPVPVSATDSAGPEALEVMARVPLMLLPDCGAAKETLKVAL